VTHNDNTQTTQIHILPKTLYHRKMHMPDTHQTRKQSEPAHLHQGNVVR